MNKFSIAPLIVRSDNAKEFLTNDLNEFFLGLRYLKLKNFWRKGLPSYTKRTPHNTRPKGRRMVLCWVWSGRWIERMEAA